MQYGCLTWDFIFSSHVIWPQARRDYYHESHAIYDELQQYNELREEIADYGIQNTTTTLKLIFFRYLLAAKVYGSFSCNCKTT